MTVVNFPSRPNLPRLSGTIRPSDCAIVVTMTAADGHEFVWTLTPRSARDFGSWYNRLAVAAERAMRERIPTPRWIQWINRASAEEIAEGAQLRRALADRIVRRRDFDRVGAELYRDGVLVPGVHVRLRREIPRNEEWRDVWQPKDRPGFRRQYELEGIAGVGPATIRRLTEAGTRLLPPSAELAPVVALSGVATTDLDGMQT